LKSGASGHGFSRPGKSNQGVCSSNYQAIQRSAGESNWRCAWPTDSESGCFDRCKLARSNAGIFEKHFATTTEICIREAEETRYWLHLLTAAEIVNANRLSALHDECSQLIAILTSTVKRAKILLRKSNRAS